MEIKLFYAAHLLPEDGCSALHSFLIMIDSSLLIFAATTALSCFTPGPAALFVVASAASQGKKQIPACIAGIATANLLYFATAAAGLAGIIIASPRLFLLIRLAGAAYLGYLGFTLLFSRKRVMERHAAGAESPSLRRSFFKALLIELSNPKAILYFGALLPQFIDTGRPLPAQFARFSFITVMLDIAAYSFYGMVGLLSARTTGTRLLTGITRGAGLLFLFVGARIAFDY